MGKSTGFLEFQRKTAPYRPIEERLSDYQEVMTLLESSEIREQAARCMECGTPFCHALGCPLHNLIPEWNDYVYKGDWHEAYKRLEMTHSLPEITGRVCPALCEQACTLSINTAPVSIRQIELAIVEHAFEQGWVTPIYPKKETGKSIAIIGSGPAGLSAASILRRLGHKITVFEKSNKIGGILRYGIPDFKLNKQIIDRRIKLMEAEGIIFQTNVDMGYDISARYLKKTFDRVLITIGASEPRNINAPGRDLDNIHFAMEYLIRSNQYVAGELDKKQLISAKDKTVMVIGGGDTGSDCVGTANRQGAKKIYQIELLPKPMTWENDYNPQWPDWPSILRTSSSHEEGCDRRWSLLTKGFSGDNNQVSHVHCVKVDWQKHPETNQYTMNEIPGTEFSFQADLVLLALGFLHVKHNRLLEDLNLLYDGRGNILIDKNYKTSDSKVYSAGDCASGASLVVKAVKQARDAAAAIHENLTK